MAAPGVTSTIALSVSAYQGSFAALGDAADTRWQLEDLVRSGLSSLEQILRSTRAWRGRVVTGEQDFSDHDDRAYRDVLSRWVEQTRSRVLPRVEQFEQTERCHGGVSGSRELRAALSRAEEALTAWEPPSPRQADGSEALRQDSGNAGALVPDTETSLTVSQMAAALDRIARPVGIEGEKLSVDPDDYPVY